VVFCVSRVSTSTVTLPPSAAVPVTVVLLALVPDTCTR